MADREQELADIAAEMEQETPETAAESVEPEAGKAEDEQTDEPQEGDGEEKPDVPAWKLEWEKTRNPHVLPDELKEWALEHQRGLTKAYEKLARAREAEQKRDAAPASRQEPDEPPPLGEDVDPRAVQALDARMAYIVRQALEQAGVNKIPEAVRQTEEQVRAIQAESRAAQRMAELASKHGVTEEIAGEINAIMQGRPEMFGLMYDDEQAKSVIELAKFRLDGRKKAAEESKRKKAAAASTTMRPGESGRRQTTPVRDYSSMSLDDIAEELHREHGLPLR